MRNLILISLTIISVTTMQVLKPSEAKNMGADLFLKNPNSYTFRCGCDLGEVLEATSNANDDMLIKYYYMCGGKKLYGFLDGKYNATTNKFEGIYNTENKFYFGPINFSFNEKGEGTGFWDNGAGTVSMLLKTK